MIRTKHVKEDGYD